MRALWNEEKPTFRGRFVNFSSIQAMPRPIQEGGPEIVVGGTSDAALHRAARSAKGWYGFAMNVEQTESVLNRLRDFDGGANLEISVTPSSRNDQELIEAFASIGVHRLISMMPTSEDRILAIARRHGGVAGVRKRSNQWDRRASLNSFDYGFPNDFGQLTSRAAAEVSNASGCIAADLWTTHREDLGCHGSCPMTCRQ